MKNNKGITLIELLATLFISIFIFIVAEKLYFSVNREWHNSVQQYNDLADSQDVMDTLAHYLIDAREVYFITGNELRFRNGANKQLMSFTYNNHTLALNHFTPQTPDDIKSAGTNQEIAPLAGNLKDAPVYTLDTGDILNISITFTYTQISVTGAASPFDRPLTTAIKLPTH